MTSQTEIEQEAERAAERFEALDVDHLEWRDAAPLRAIAEANEGIQAAKDRLAAAVEAARVERFSWQAIGVMLGISRQAAQERFGTKTPAS